MSHPMSRVAPLLMLCLATGAFAANPPRLTFTRRVPAPHDLAPAEHVVVIRAIGDNRSVDDFVEDFADTVSRAGTLRIENAVDRNHHTIDAQMMREHPADAYVAVNQFTCSGHEKNAEGSEHDPTTGDRIKRMHHWVDVRCTARVEILGSNGKMLVSYGVMGEGTSPRSTELSDDERAVAYSQAAHYAAVRAAEEITPRFVRESIELDEHAPQFDEAFSMIRSGRLEDSRAIWSAALRRHADSPALNFDLAAVCEALGDLDAAHRYFQAAVKLSPKETHYRSELELFRKRVRR